MSKDVLDEECRDYEYAADEVKRLRDKIERLSAEIAILRTVHECADTVFTNEMMDNCPTYEHDRNLLSNALDAANVYRAAANLAGGYVLAKWIDSSLDAVGFRFMGAYTYCDGGLCVPEREIEAANAELERLSAIRPKISGSTVAVDHSVDADFQCKCGADRSHASKHFEPGAWMDSSALFCLQRTDTDSAARK